MNAIIFTGGRYRSPGFYRKYLEEHPADCIVAADAGAGMLMELGVVPRLLMGDLDSIRPEVLAWIKEKDIPVYRHPTHKNETDTELAVTWCLEQGAGSIALLGALGTRFDHSLANVHLLYRMLCRGVEAVVADEYNTLFLIKGRKALALEPGTTLSLLAYTEAARGITLTGFEYPLDNAGLDHLEPGLGVSNVAADPRQVVEVKEGLLLADVVREEF